MDGLVGRLKHYPLLGDGAMGTLLYSRGVSIHACLEALVVERPELVAGIHAEYARAGADVITTHTFGANRMRLAFHGLETMAHEYNLRAVAIAQQVRVESGRDFLIAGNVGPVGKAVAWERAGERDAVAETFREQMRALAEAGVDLLLLETFSDVEELVLAIKVAKELSSLPIVASVSYGGDGLTLAQQGVDEVTTRLLASGVDVIGTNCSVGPAQMVATLGEMRRVAPQGLFSVSPNAGLPTVLPDGTLCYPVGAEEFAAFVPEFLAMGASLVGGCCGTMPEHVRAMRRALVMGETPME